MFRSPFSPSMISSFLLYYTSARAVLPKPWALFWSTALFHHIFGRHRSTFAYRLRVYAASDFGSWGRPSILVRSGGCGTVHPTLRTPHHPGSFVGIRGRSAQATQSLKHVLNTSWADGTVTNRLRRTTLWAVWVISASGWSPLLASVVFAWIRPLCTVLSSMLASGNNTSLPSVSGLIFLRDW